MIIDWKFDVSSPDNNITDIKIVDLKDWVWPRNPPYTQEWSNSLPTILLNNTLNMYIGSNNQSEINLIPFESWRNEQFLIKINERSSQSTPEWIKIYNSNQTFSILRNKLNSISESILEFQAQLISYTFPYDSSHFSTQIYQTKINFINENWNFVDVERKSFLIVNKFTSLNIHFSDIENDPILTNGQNQFIDFMITLNQTSSSGFLYLQASKTSSELVELLISYTDNYHKDPSLWKIFSLKYYIFESEPPVFESIPQNIELNRCQSSTVQLPQFFDPDYPDSK